MYVGEDVKKAKKYYRELEKFFKFKDNLTPEVIRAIEESEFGSVEKYLEFIKSELDIKPYVIEIKNNNDLRRFLLTATSMKETEKKKYEEINGVSFDAIIEYAHEVLRVYELNKKLKNEGQEKLEKMFGIVFKNRVL